MEASFGVSEASSSEAGRRSRLGRSTSAARVPPRADWALVDGEVELLGDHGRAVGGGDRDWVGAGGPGFRGAAERSRRAAKGHALRQGAVLGDLRGGEAARL